MSRRWTILLGLAAIAAVVFLVLIEPRLTSTREDLATRDFLFNFDAGQIKGIRIVSGEDLVEIKRAGGGWQIGPKPKDRASTAKVRAIIETAATLRVADIIRESELTGDRKPGDYGLDDARYEIDFLGDGAAGVVFGRDAVGEGRIYVRKTDGGDVFIVPDDLQRLAFVNPREFRDRRLSDLTADRIDRFVLRLGTGEIEVVRTANGWQIVRPLKAPADAWKVKAFLDPLLGMNILDFVADDSDDLSAYGLAAPRAELILYPEGEKRAQAVRIGAGAKSEAGAQALIAQFTARDSVYHLPARTWELLQTTPDALRDRALLPLNLDTVDRIRVREGGDAIELARAGDAWRAGTGPAVDARSVAGVAGHLAAAKVGEYLPLNAKVLAESGIDAPRGEIAFDAWLSENTPETVAGRHPIAKITVGKIADGQAWVRVNDDPEVCVIPSAPVEALFAETRRWAEPAAE
jgi:hypothetical protein